MPAELEDEKNHPVFSEFVRMKGSTLNRCCQDTGCEDTSCSWYFKGLNITQFCFGFFFPVAHRLFVVDDLNNMF